jgi:hypothetical protein
MGGSYIAVLAICVLNASKDDALLHLGPRVAADIAFDVGDR